MGGASTLATFTVKLSVAEAVPSLTVISILTLPDSFVEVTAIEGVGLVPWIARLALGIIVWLEEPADRTSVVGSLSISSTATASGPVVEFSSIFWFPGIVTKVGGSFIAWTFTSNVVCALAGAASET